MFIAEHLLSIIGSSSSTHHTIDAKSTVCNDTYPSGYARYTIFKNVFNIKLMWNSVSIRLGSTEIGKMFPEPVLCKLFNVISTLVNRRIN